MKLRNRTYHDNVRGTVHEHMEANMRLENIAIPA